MTIEAIPYRSGSLGGGWKTPPDRDGAVAPSNEADDNLGDRARQHITERKLGSRPKRYGYFTAAPVRSGSRKHR